MELPLSSTSGAGLKIATGLLAQRDGFINPVAETAGGNEMTRIGRHVTNL
jgi:hypothetical protein